MTIEVGKWIIPFIIVQVVAAVRAMYMNNESARKVPDWGNFITIWLTLSFAVFLTSFLK